MLARSDRPAVDCVAALSSLSICSSASADLLDRCKCSASAMRAEGSPGAVLRGDVERNGRAAQINTFGGGVVEVLREIVATTGLGMVRQAR